MVLLGAEYEYELSGYLGNVSVTFTRVEDNHEKAKLVNYTDYYPFGWEVPGAKKPEDDFYRFAYQGQFAEKDEETGFNAFELRLYDSRIARWMTTDPAKQYHSPYLSFGNNPISRIDPDGGDDDDIHRNSSSGEVKIIETNDNFDREFVDGKFVEQHSQGWGKSTFTNAEIFSFPNSTGSFYLYENNKIIAFASYEYYGDAETNGASIDLGLVDLFSGYNRFKFYQTFYCDYNENGSIGYGIDNRGSKDNFYLDRKTDGYSIPTPFDDYFDDMPNRSGSPLNMKWIGQLQIYGIRGNNHTGLDIYEYGWSTVNGVTTPKSPKLINPPSSFHIKNAP